MFRVASHCAPCLAFRQPSRCDFKAQGKEQLVTVAEDEDDPGWRFSYRGFTLDSFQKELMKFWNIPEAHLDIKYDKDFPGRTKVHLPKEKTLGALKM